MLLTSAVISGLGLGSMYGLIALGFHVTYVVSNTVNFSQGSAMMLGAVLGYTFAVKLGWPLPLAAATALALCALFGAVIERTLVRPFADRGSDAWLMATVAGGIVLDNVVLLTGGQARRLRVWRARGAGHRRSRLGLRPDRRVQHRHPRARLHAQRASGARRREQGLTMPRVPRWRAKRAASAATLECARRTLALN